VPLFNNAIRNEENIRGRISNTTFFPYVMKVLQNVQIYLHGYDETGAFVVKVTNKMQL